MSSNIACTEGVSKVSSSYANSIKTLKRSISIRNVLPNSTTMKSYETKLDQNPSCESGNCTINKTQPNVNTFWGRDDNRGPNELSYKMSKLLNNTICSTGGDICNNTIRPTSRDIGQRDALRKPIITSGLDDSSKDGHSISIDKSKPPKTLAYKQYKRLTPELFSSSDALRSQIYSDISYQSSSNHSIPPKPSDVDISILPTTSRYLKSSHRGHLQVQNDGSQDCLENEYSINSCVLDNTRNCSTKANILSPQKAYLKNSSVRDKKDSGAGASEEKKIYPRYIGRLLREPMDHLHSENKTQYNQCKESNIVINETFPQNRYKYKNERINNYNQQFHTEQPPRSSANQTHNHKNGEHSPPCLPQCLARKAHSIARPENRPGSHDNDDDAEAFQDTPETDSIEALFRNKFYTTEAKARLKRILEAMNAMCKDAPNLDDGSFQKGSTHNIEYSLTPQETDLLETIARDYEVDESTNDHKYLYGGSREVMCGDDTGGILHNKRETRYPVTKIINTKISRDDTFKSKSDITLSDSAVQTCPEIQQIGVQTESTNTAQNTRFHSGCEGDSGDSTTYLDQEVACSYSCSNTCGNDGVPSVVSDEDVYHNFRGDNKMSKRFLKGHNHRGDADVSLRSTNNSYHENVKNGGRSKIRHSTSCCPRTHIFDPDIEKDNCYTKQNICDLVFDSNRIEKKYSERPKNSKTSEYTPSSTNRQSLPAPCMVKQHSSQARGINERLEEEINYHLMNSPPNDACSNQINQLNCGHNILTHSPYINGELVIENSDISNCSESMHLHPQHLRQSLENNVDLEDHHTSTCSPLRHQLMQSVPHKDIPGEPSMTCSQTPKLISREQSLHQGIPPRPAFPSPISPNFSKVQLFTSPQSPQTTQSPLPQTPKRPPQKACTLNRSWISKALWPNATNDS